ncbi:MAG: hypothetical protein ACOX29_02870 [Bacillota bacterium]|jgi:hypothetical protein|nr:hypothetical protein [Bacillota bacterium]NLU55064.1 hypothetical protein [Bacillota bacterium]HOA91369.1 hypothetical protein [Bacillota bacterium]HOJ45844.1 hypothetical protein [Bacillota bacterium]HOL13658.1 hypothetical protein [Bacillota bacterium]
MWVLGLVFLLCFSGVADANAGLFQKTAKNAVLHIPWDESKTVTWEFNQKDWGTWNVFGVSVNKEPISARSGTDWEYVYLGRPTTTSAWYEWMGGNHQNEILKTLDFIVDGKKVQDGTYKVSESLVIVETTDLVFPADNMIVGSVVRRYTIEVGSPNRMDFAQSTTWHTDMYMDRAYVCMLPIYKRHGRFFKMGNVEDSFVDGIRTDANKGLAPVTETFLYGDMGYGMIAGIKDLSAVDEYKYSKWGAFVWDLSADHVKLYYPRAYEMGPRFVEAGSVWESESYYIVVEVNE